MAEKKFCDMDPAERFEDLRERVVKFNMLQLPGQPQGMHMGTTYLVGDLLRELERYKGAPILDLERISMMAARVPLSELSPTALVTMPMAAELERRIAVLEDRLTWLK